MIYETTLYSFISGIIFCLFHLVSKIIYPYFFSTKNQKKYGLIFNEILFFTVLLISIYACFINYGNTIFIILVPIFAFLIVKTKNYKKFKLKNHYSIKDFLTMFMLCQIVGLVYIFYPLEDVIEQDTLFYSRIGENLHLYLRENLFNFFNYLDKYNGNNPYHYFELYLNNMLYQFLGNYIPNIIILKHIVYVFLTSLLVYGIYGIIECFIKIRWYHFFVPLFLLLCDFSWTSNWFTTIYPINTVIFQNPKFLNYSLFCISFIYFIIIGRFSDGIIILFFAPIASILSFPSIYFGLTFYFLFNKLLKFKSIMKNTHFYVVIYLVLSVILFYVITGISTTEISGESNNIYYYMKKTIFIYKASIVYSLKQIFGVYIIFILPFTLYYFSKDKAPLSKNLHTLLVLTSIMTIISIISFQLIAYIHDAFQIPHFCYLLMKWVFIVFILYLISIDSKIAYVTSLLIIILPSFFLSFKNFEISNSNSIANYQLKKRGYTLNQIESIDKYFSSQLKPIIGGYFNSKKRINKEYVSRRYSLTYHKGSSLAYLTSGVQIHPLTFTSIWNDITMEKFNLNHKIKKFREELPYYKDEIKISNEKKLNFLNEFINTNKYKFVITDTLENQINCEFIINK